MAIDGSKIIHAVLEGSRIRESKGIIPLFGVYLSLFPTRYYNRLSFEFEKKLGATRTDVEAASLLTEASQACGYATFHGIRTSREWEEIVKPMIDRKEDQIMGFTAVAVAFGWGDLEVRELIPGKILRMRANDSYEANGYLKDYGIAKSGKCYMLRGVFGGFMDLLYGEDYPDGCFTFLGGETSCRAKGDACCEFIVQRSSD
ncbi:MAG: 4-vinyl reductase [Desulfobacteraceae bacterium]|nr:4-vinyl reductase [Desulfobacteraceae bacterium]